MTDENYIIMTDDEEEIYSAAEYEDQGFVINNDNKASWALKVIKQEQEETERFLRTADKQIEELTKKKEALKADLDRRTGYLKGLLYRYFETVPHKETKTQQTYKLLDGQLVFKKPSVKIVKPEDDETLISYLEQNQPELVEIVKKAVWCEFKKNLTITDDGGVVDMATGEKLDFVKTEETEGSFDVKVG